MNNIINIIRSQVFDICTTFQTKTGDNPWKHINTVAEISERLAIDYNADKEIVILGAYLHDISNALEIGNPDDHHIHSMYAAEEMLIKHNYPSERIERVKKCVLHHRGSVTADKETVEEECVADADAISHIFNIPDLFYVAYAVKLLDADEGAEWVRKKLFNDFNKLSKRSKDIYSNRYEMLIKSVLSSPNM